ncbi:hypothetical protein DO97_13040 [Neosynechococcus sphagnicola sy1]|uniref:DUF8166 domain-containing protein n=1 Tax=Neosynechococcus sphagnicola sy1 TaxID=1497020 RepID=A0A098TN19_9CYAN|nr:hypothetical protein [Neosynechococcus sphagnicola]KGF73730.1 hypothetical protein DO97_13040 [Neosynechococcus sphagnicola sy1]
MQLGKVVKSNSHCDYVVQLDDVLAVASPPQPDDYGFGCFVKLSIPHKPWVVGLIYDSQLLNPQFASPGPRLSAEPDLLFTPDLVGETRTLLWTLLIGTLETVQGRCYGVQGIPQSVVPVNTLVYRMSPQEVYQFHLNPQQRPQFCYYGHLLRCGGSFAAELTQRVLQDLVGSDLFSSVDQRALAVLCKELTWRNTMAAMR